MKTFNRLQKSTEKYINDNQNILALQFFILIAVTMVQTAIQRISAEARFITEYALTAYTSFHSLRSPKYAIEVNNVYRDKRFVEIQNVFSLYLQSDDKEAELFSECYSNKFIMLTDRDLEDPIPQQFDLRTKKCKHLKRFDENEQECNYHGYRVLENHLNDSLCHFDYPNQVSLVDLPACHIDQMKKQTQLSKLDYDICSSNVMTQNQVFLQSFGLYESSCYGVKEYSSLIQCKSDKSNCRRWEVLDACTINSFLSLKLMISKQGSAIVQLPIRADFIKQAYGVQNNTDESSIIRWNYIRLIGQDRLGDEEQFIGVSPFGEDWGEAGQVRIAPASLVSKEDGNVIAFNFLVDESKIRETQFNGIEETKMMIEDQNTKMMEVVDDKGYLKMGGKWGEYNREVRASEDEGIGGEERGGEYIDGNEGSQLNESNSYND